MERTYRIIVGVDGSEAGVRALKWAVVEAERRDRSGQTTSVQAMTAWEFDPASEPESVAIRLEDPREAARRAVSETVSNVCDAHPGVPVADEVVQGAAADVLVRAADDADLLVIGSHGHSRAFHAVLGSISEACIRTATCPVLVIPMARESSTSRSGQTLTTAGS